MRFLELTQQTLREHLLIGKFVRLSPSITPMVWFIQMLRSVLKCNELFCNVSGEELEGGEGGGVIAMLEVLADSYIKNEQAKQEKKNQEAQIAEANRLLPRESNSSPHQT